MNCYNHNDVKGESICNECGAWLCYNCIATDNNKTICNTCITKHTKEDINIHESNPLPHKNKPNCFISLIASIIFPGAGLMYLGLMKKGLLISACFFLTTYLNSQFGVALSGIIIPIIYVSSIFYTYHCCKKIVSGIKIEDNIDASIKFLKRYCALIILGFIALIILNRISLFVLIIIFIAFSIIYSFYLYTKNGKNK